MRKISHSYHIVLHLALPLLVGMGLAMASDANVGIKTALAVGASFSPTSLGVAASALKTGKMLDTPRWPIGCGIVRCG